MAIRLSESRLRKIIREELKRMDEMAFAGSLGVVDAADYEGMPADPKKQSAVRKYTQSGFWLKNATNYYKNLPFNVWIATVAGIAGAGSAFEEYGIDVDDGYEASRSMIMPIEAGKEALIGVGYEPSLVERVGPNDLIILISNIEMSPSALPSPWMVIHAIYDGDRSGADAPYVLSPTFRAVRRKIEYATVPGVLTMASARSGALGHQSDEDAAAEAMCQELITGRGYHYNEDAIADVKKRYPFVDVAAELEELSRLVKKAGDEFRTNARGKMICARV